MKKIDLSEFKAGTKIGVVGDLMLDKYLIGDVDRISPEAPVPVVEIKDTKYVLGGAANVMSNARTMLAEVYGFGVMGNDNEGRILRSELLRKSIHTDGIVIDDSRPTTTKCRILAGHYQLLRYDLEEKTEIEDQILDRVIEKVSQIIPSLDILVLSDYDKGVLCAKMISKLKLLAKENGVRILVDPKLRNTKTYDGVDYVKINLHNAERVTGISPSTPQDIQNICLVLRQVLNCENIVLTRGKDGLTYLSRGEVGHVKTMAKDVFDVTGAGDVMTASLAIALAHNYDIDTACHIGSLASAVKVSKVGTYSVSFTELEEAVRTFNGGPS